MKKRITRVTTKKGDDGSTGMADGSRIDKSSNLISSIGEIDELNSWIGYICSLPELVEEADFLKNIQNCLFDIGGSLTMRAKTNFDISNTLLMDQKIKTINKLLPELENFILPGGHQVSSAIHLTRTVCRRAERSIVKVQESEKVDANCIAYLNRLSDFLFVLARKININLRVKEVTWSQKK